jgi:hypothetical protein
MSLPAWDDELVRLAALHRYHILDAAAEQAFDDLTSLAASLCDAPISLVSLVDHNRQWLKSKVGLTVSETRREFAFCAHAIRQPHKRIEAALRDSETGVSL